MDASILTAPFVKCRTAHVVFTAQLRHRATSPRLLSNIAIIWLSLYLDIFMPESPAFILRENSTFGISYFPGGLPPGANQGSSVRNIERCCFGSK